MPDTRPIGIFDSGLGGLTVTRELIRILPHENIVYFGDTDRVPYGTKSRETIFRFARQDERFLLSRDVKLIVAACGTVSSVAAETSNTLPVPFFEVVSHAVKAAVAASHTGRIGVIGTAATIASGAHKRQILALWPDARVFSASCTLFVPLVEAGWIDDDDPVVLETARKYLLPLKEAGIDTLILGCTHYPILTSVIRKVLGEDVTLINSGEATALAVRRELESSGMLNNSPLPGSHHFCVSDITPSFPEIARLLLGEEIGPEKIERVLVSEFPS